MKPLKNARKKKSFSNLAENFQFSHDPLISHEEVNNYFITNEDGEEDVVRISEEVSSDDDDAMSCDVALHCGEVTIDEDVMS